MGLTRQLTKTSNLELRCRQNEGRALSRNLRKENLKVDRRIMFNFYQNSKIILLPPMKYLYSPNFNYRAPEKPVDFEKQLTKTVVFLNAKVFFREYCYYFSLAFQMS